MKRNQKGFTAVGILIIVVVIGLIGVIGWLVYDRQKSPKSTVADTQKQGLSKTMTETAKEAVSNYTMLKLASDSVTFETPKHG